MHAYCHKHFCKKTEIKLVSKKLAKNFSMKLMDYYWKDVPAIKKLKQLPSN